MAESTDEDAWLESLFSEATAQIATLHEQAREALLPGEPLWPADQTAAVDATV